MTEHNNRLQEINRFSANLDLIITQRIIEHQNREFNRLVQDTRHLASRIRVMTGNYGILPESQREDFLAFADGRTQKMLLRWELEGVRTVRREYGRVWEYRADGHMNMIDSGVIIYTTEPFEKPTGSYGEQEAWEPKITPFDVVRNFRVRGLA